jgi:flagellin-like hook-associated protein FlgL
MQTLATAIKSKTAKDEAANIALSSKMQKENTGNTVANSNTKQAQSLLNIADNSLDSMLKSLQRARTLTVQAANSTYSDEERKMIQNEVDEIGSGIKQLYNNTKYDNKNIFNPGKATEVPQVMSYQDAIAAGYTDDQIIKDANDLITKITDNHSGDFILVSNINMASLGTLTTNAIAYFEGNLDGGGHTISNYSSSNPLFGAIIGGSVKNLTMDNVNVTNGSPLVNYFNGSEISNVHSTGSVNNGSGLVDSFQGGVMKNCSSSCQITNSTGFSSSQGGLVGYAYNVTVSDSFSTGNINSISNSYIGGLIGNAGNITVDNCYATGDINSTGNSYEIGGFIGYTYDSTITNSFATGNISSQNGGQVGGFAGYLNDTNISDCYAKGNISSQNENASLGGFAAYLYGGTVKSSYAEGNISGLVDYLGGFTGSAYSNISDCTASGDINISKNSYAGGFTGIAGYGYNITNCRATGNISIDDANNSYNGGFVGQGMGTISNSFSTGNITATNSSSVSNGGFAGMNFSIITNSYTTGNISVDNTTSTNNGGFVGMGGATNSYTTGNVTVTNSTNDNTGGFLGHSAGTTSTNCYATGNVTGNSYTGGFGGFNVSPVNNSYASGNVTGNSASTGGFIGENHSVNVDNNAYANNMTQSVGVSELISQAQFSGNINTVAQYWDAAVWDFSGTMPHINNAGAQRRQSQTNDQGLNIQIGAGYQPEDVYEINTGFELGDLLFDLTTPKTARETLDELDKEINFLTALRSKLGSQSSALDSINSYQNSKINNYTSSNSAIKDTDFAKNTAELTRLQILQQSTQNVYMQYMQMNKQLVYGLLNIQ